MIKCEVCGTNEGCLSGTSSITFFDHSVWICIKCKLELISRCKSALREMKNINKMNKLKYPLVSDHSFNCNTHKWIGVEENNIRCQICGKRKSEIIGSD